MNTLWASLLLVLYFFSPIESIANNVCSERRMITYISHVRKTKIVPYQYRNWLGFPKTEYRVEWYYDPLVSLAS